MTRFVSILWVFLAALFSTLGAAQAQALDPVRFGTNWLTEAAHGGFYQALAEGTYRKYGLDVTIVPGGANVNNRLLLTVGKLDFYMSANTLQSFDAVEQNIPIVTVAASFQKDPQVLIAHPGVLALEDLKKLTLFVSPEGMISYFQWLKTEYGFDESKVKPYTFNAQPFLADKNSAVQRFVDASAIGWYHYIYGDSRLGNELIKKQNPEMTDALLAYSVAKMKEFGIVDSGDSIKF